jgi:hypothetical protein
MREIVEITGEIIVNKYESPLRVSASLRENSSSDVSARAT